jgi:L-rhamnose isomerase
MTPPAGAPGFAEAVEAYGRRGVDAERAMALAAEVPLSVHCWQGDDVAGFERGAAALAGSGLAVTGGYPGRACTPDQLRADIDFALHLSPGCHRVNIHAMYAEADGSAVDRDQIEARHFTRWMDWAAERGLALDFNATLFGHPKAASGFTLASRDEGVRRFWIEHVVRCRAIGAEMGRRLGSACWHNLWIPDGMKDQCVDRLGYRERLLESLDAVFAVRQDAALLLDSLESKLFGIGSESFVVGSHEFYLGYCQRSGLIPCLDLGHFHPTESVGDKVSALLPFHRQILIHVSRGVRWDSDHVAVLDATLGDLALEMVRSRALDRLRLALDYFDASVNRVAAWVVGMRATRQAVLRALLEPIDQLRALEAAGDYTGRLVLLEETKTLPWAAAWRELCQRCGVPPEGRWLAQVRRYEAEVLLPRGS